MSGASGPIMPHIHSQAGHSPYARNWRAPEEIPDPGAEAQKKARSERAAEQREHRKRLRAEHSEYSTDEHGRTFCQCGARLRVLRRQAADETFMKEVMYEHRRSV